MRSRSTSASRRTSPRVVERGSWRARPSVRVVDAVDRFAAEFLTRAIKANGLYEGKYPMVSRARAAVDRGGGRAGRARGRTPHVVAHGCTGKGNDQVRFEVSFGVLAPDLEVLAPIRDADIPREKALALAEEWGIPLANVVSSYSVDENLWGRTAECGPLEDPWVAPPEDAFARTAAPAAVRASRQRSCSLSSAACPWRSTASRRLARPDPRARSLGGTLRVRPRRHDREPPRRDQVARALRGARRARDHRGAPRPRGPDARARGRAPQAARSNSAGPTSSTTGSGSARSAPRSTRTSTPPRRT